MLILVTSNAKNKAETDGQSAQCDLRDGSWTMGAGSSNLSTRTAQAIEGLARTASLGPPPLIEGEDGVAYNQFHGGVAASVKPKDFLEEIWVRDIADLSWEVLRLRRIKAQLLKSWTAVKIRVYLKDLCGASQAQKLSAELGDPSVIARVDELLSANGLSLESITAEVFVELTEALERIDRMMMNAETRRNNALHEVERHRSTLAQALRRATDEVVDAEFEDVRPGQRAQKDAA